MDRARERQDGFQLVELMVVLIIVGLTLAMAVPNFARRNSWERTQGYAREISGRVQTARQMAVSRRVPYRLVLDRANRSYRFDRMEPDSSWTPDPDRDYLIEGLIEMTAEVGGSGTAAEIHFETRGTVRAEDAPAYIRFIDEQGDTATVAVVRTGRVSVRMAAPNP